MDDLFGIILFLIFVLAPIIEQIRKQGRKQQPPTQRPASRLPQPRPPELPQRRSETEEISSKSRDAASVLIPDDLWQILTGEARPPVLTTPPQEPARRKPIETVYIPPEEAEDEEAVAVEDVNVEVTRTSREAVRREHERRHRPSTEAVSLEVEPQIVSLETPLATSAVRHAAFHDKLIKTAAAPVVAKQRLVNLSDPEQIRRAFVMQEILGKPRGLD